MACMARDLLTPLESTRKTLSNMSESGKKPDADADIQSALSSLSIMDRICNETIDNFRTDLADVANEKRSAAAASSSSTDLGGVLPMPSIDEEDQGGGEVEGRSDSRPGLSRGDSATSFSTLNSGGTFSSRLHTVVLSEFVETLRTAAAQACPSDGSSPPIEIVADSKVPEEFLSDELKLFRSALHLLVNAARHTPAGTGTSSESYIRMRIYVKKMGRRKSMLMFECRDTGTGVDSEQRQKLYSPFSMALDNASLANHDRPGLGLYSVAINISSLGGRYGYRPRDKESWDSTPRDQPTGSIFWFAIPLSVNYCAEEEPSATGGKTKEDVSSSPKASDSPPFLGEKRKMISVQDSDKYDAKEIYDAVSKAMGGDGDSADAATCATAFGDECLVAVKGAGSDSGSESKRALVIDDSIVIRKSIGRALTNLGFQVTYASDGMQGLQALQSSKFDVVFCDFLMPVLDGLDCIEQYRTWESKHRPDFHQKIVGLSAHAGEADIDRGKKAGMDTFVSKNSKLKDMLNRAITLSETFSSNTPSAPGGSSANGSTSAGSPAQSSRAASSSAVPPSPLDTPMNRLATHPAYASLMLRRSGGVSAAGGAAGGFGKNAGVLNTASALNSFAGQTDDAGSARGGCPIGSAAALVERRRQMAEDTPGMECIICEDSRSAARALAKAATAAGWTPRVADDAEQALSLLKTKRWGAAIIEEGGATGELSGVQLVSAFRDWEADHRTVKQNNLFSVCNSPTNGSTGSCPAGFNGEIRRPIKEADVISLLTKASARRGDREIIER